MDNFDISHSEKDFLGGGRRGKEAGGASLGDLNENYYYLHLIIRYQSHAKDWHGNAARKP